MCIRVTLKKTRASRTNFQADLVSKPGEWVRTPIDASIVWTTGWTHLDDLLSERPCFVVVGASLLFWRKYSKNRLRKGGKVLSCVLK